MFPRGRKYAKNRKTEMQKGETELARTGTWVEQSDSLLGDFSSI